MSETDDTTRPPKSGVEDAVAEEDRDLDGPAKLQPRALESRRRGKKRARMAPGASPNPRKERASGSPHPRCTNPRRNRAKRRRMHARAPASSCALTDDEKDARLRALTDAKYAEEEARKRAEEDARRRAGDEEKLKREHAAAAKRHAEEEARKHADEEAKRHAELEAARRLEKKEGDEKPSGAVPSVAARRGRNLAEEEEEAKTVKKGGKVVAKAPVTRKPTGSGRRTGKLTITRALSGEDERMRSVAAFSPPAGTRPPHAGSGSPRRSARHHHSRNHHGRRTRQPHGAPRGGRHQGADEERHDGDGHRRDRRRHGRTGRDRIRPYGQARRRIRRARRPARNRRRGRRSGVARAGRHHHGPCRPRQDLAARRAAQDRRRRGRSRRHHPAYRRLSGDLAGKRQEDHLHRHAGPRRVHRDARAAPRSPTS